VYDESKLSTKEKVRQNHVMDAVRLKADWAHDHIADLDSAMERFFDSKPNPYRIEWERDSQTSEYVYHFRGASPYPRDIVGHVGDALHNLWSSLDHLAWQLVIANGGSPGRDTCFPIWGPLNKDPNGFFYKSVKGIRPDAIKDIAAQEPYKGGNDKLWLLHELDRLDKHREILGIGTTHLGHSALPSKKREAQEDWIESHPGTELVPPMDHLVVSAAQVRMLKPGDELLRVPYAEYDPHMDFRLAVAFDVPGVVEAKPVLDTLREMEQVVFEIICDFRTAGHFRLVSVTHPIPS
jgi:hypothetical protein